MEIKTKLNSFFNALSFIELCTVGLDGTPEVRSMLNLRNPQICPHLEHKFTKDNFTLYFTTNTSSSKIKQVAANKKASVYLTNPGTYEGILLTGEVFEETDKEVKDSLWDDSWKLYYPQGKSGGDYSVLRFEPHGYKFYDGQFNVVQGKLSN